MNTGDRSADDGAIIAVIGAGAWGTALAWLIAGQGHPVRLWARREEQAVAIEEDRENRLRLPGAKLPENIHVTADLAAAVEDITHAIVATPSAHVREVARRIAPHRPDSALLISATKGLEIETAKRMSEVLIEETGAGREQVLALSGPNLSGEIVAGMPAVSVIAGAGREELRTCQALLATPLFRIYANCDILGVEICGALKNVIAIAAGVCDGLGYGANAKAALVTRGLAEIGRLGTTLGAARSTFWGVAGVGDVLATCNSHLSRNWQVGHRLGRGESIAAINRTQSAIAEGISTTAAACDLARNAQVDAPITFALYEVLFEGASPEAAVGELMTRRSREETEEWQ